MNRPLAKILRLILIVLSLILLTLPVLAQSGSTYDLSWNTTDGGGGQSIGGVFSLIGTVGQVDAGAMSAGNLTLLGGFWTGGESSCFEQNGVFLPLIIR